MTIIPVVAGALGTVHQSLGKWTGRVGNRGTNRDYPDCSIVEIGNNTEKSLGDLGCLAVTQTPISLQQCKKPRMAYNNDNNNSYNNNNNKLKIHQC